MAEINSTAQVTSALTGVSDVLTPVFTLMKVSAEKHLSPLISRLMSPV